MVSKKLTLLVIVLVVTSNIVEVLNPDDLESYDVEWQSLDDEEPYNNSVSVLDDAPTSWVYRFGVPLPCYEEAVMKSTNDVSKLCSNGIWNSCVGRCGDVSHGVPYTCACDPLCHFYDDCCWDYGRECQHFGNASSDNISFHENGQFECFRIDEESRHSVLMVNRCATWWSKDVQFDEERLLCENGTSASVVPVTSRSSTLVFRNVHCAICNGFTDIVEWTIQFKCSNDSEGVSLFNITSGNLDSCQISAYLPPTFLDGSRACSYNIGSCSSNATSQSDIDKCSSYSKPVFGPLDKDGQPQIYKNIHCASCNGIDMKDLHCPAWDVLVSSSVATNHFGFNKVVPIFGNELTAFSNAHCHMGDDIPAAFTILFNFGTNGYMKTMFDSQDKEIWDMTKANCQDLEIWDPFTNMCRRIYCSSQFVLVNFQCVKIYDNSTASRGQPVNNGSRAEALLRQDMSTVEMSLVIRLNKPLSKSVTETLEQNFLHTLASSVAASSDRFANFTLVTNDSLPGNESYSENSIESESVRIWTKGTKTQVTFLLTECHDTEGNLSEPSIEKIVSSLSTGISLSQYFLRLDNNITVHLTGISEKLVASLNDSELVSWCEQGHKLYYENNDIEPLFNMVNNSYVAMDVHVIATNITYHPGQYLASVVFQGDQQHREANFSGYVIVCHKVTENNCTRVAIPPLDYELLSNASLRYFGKENLSPIIDEDSYEILPDQTALVCYELVPDNPDGNQASYFDVERGQRVTNMLLTGISLLAGLLTMITYVSFSELRNMPGIYVMNLTGCLWLFQFVFLLGERRSVSASNPIECKVVSVAVHYFGLCYFFWMNVIAYDLHRTFSPGSKILTAASDRRSSVALRLFVYAYGCPAVIVGMCTVFDFVRLPVDIRIDYGTGDFCWIGNPLAQFFSFVLVVGLIFLSNVVFYVRTVLFISRIRKATVLTTGHVSKRAHSIVYLRIATVLGFGWMLGFLITTPFQWDLLNVVLSYLFIALNASPGTLIFIVFVCNGKVCNYYGQSCVATVFRLGKCPDCSKVICVCQKPVVRTISNETTRSMVSAVDHFKSNTE